MPTPTNQPSAQPGPVQGSQQHPGAPYPGFQYLPPNYQQYPGPFNPAYYNPYFQPGAPFQAPLNQVHLGYLRFLHCITVNLFRYLISFLSSLCVPFILNF